LIFSLIAAMVLISSIVITGYLGQLSLVHLAVAGTAAFATSRFAHLWALGFPAAPILGVIAAVVLGVLCGIPALRVRGVSLAVITLAAAVAIQDFGFSNSKWVGAAGGSVVPDPSLFGLDLSANGSLHGFNGAEPSPAFGWFVLVVLGVIVLIVCNLRRSALGLDMLAVRANERAAAAAGVGVRRTKLVGFAIASAIAGIGGVTLAFLYGSVTAGNFDILTALALIAFGYIFGITSVVGAISGGLIFVGGITAFALEHWFGLEGTWITLSSGLLLIVVLIWQPAGLATTLAYGDRRLGRRSFVRRQVAPPLASDAADLVRTGRG
jgi:branched-chain amino acid transport system permease protein